MLRVWTVLCVAAFAAVATTSQASARGACPSAARAGTLPRWSQGGILHGNFDGTSPTETATIRDAPNAPAYCGFFLVVAGRAYAIENQLANKQLVVGEAADVVPRVEAVIDLGAGRDLVVAADQEGASNLEVAVYAVLGSRLERIPGAGEFGVFGFANATTTVRCTKTGLVRKLDYYAGTGWSLEIHTYRLRDWKFVAVSHQMWHGSAKAMQGRAAAAGMNGPQFGGCIVAGTIRP